MKLPIGLRTLYTVMLSNAHKKPARVEQIGNQIIIYRDLPYLPYRFQIVPWMGTIV